MVEIKKKSVIPIYGFGAVWALYCLIFPLFRTWHLIVLVCIAVLAYIVLSRIFLGTVELIEVPVAPERSGDDKIDAMLSEGERAVGEMRTLREAIPGETVRLKLDEIISVTNSIFKKLLIEPNVYPQVKRFADFYLPTTIKLLHTYDRFGKSGSDGVHITGTLEQIDSAFDNILTSYKKFYDSLFANQALDIETDIGVLETILKRDGLL
ncbi:MAG: 5-bromo-4-chloroindolyl phosphate hydrolysis family protein [Oscillospiraceae bacterium]|nr:5-bromo-4-chloroindolyl phosphate hydrolysis family protein [Oscillospiraceae bacterium]